jgi:hypothetical protein
MPAKRFPVVNDDLVVGNYPVGRQAGDRVGGLPRGPRAEVSANMARRCDTRMVDAIVAPSREARQSGRA